MIPAPNPSFIGALGVLSVAPTSASRVSFSCSCSSTIFLKRWTRLGLRCRPRPARVMPKPAVAPELVESDTSLSLTFTTWNPDHPGHPHTTFWKRTTRT